MKGTLLRVRPLRVLFFACALALPATAFAAAGGPRLEGLRLVAEIPAELPPRVSSIAYDGEKIWVVVYHGRGLYATLDPSTLRWEVGRDESHQAAIRGLTGRFQSPGGICFDGGRLWVGASYGDSFGYVDTRDWKTARAFKGRQREEGGGPREDATQVYAGLACDGANLWIAWHWFRYDIPASRTQLLLKVDAGTGKVVAEYPLPGGSGADMTHGLTWDGSRLWHIKGSLLSAIDPADGWVRAQYELPGVRRASGLAWDGRSLWIAEFDGKVWRLPF